MTSNEKKPPVNIGDLKKKEEEHKPGSLTYLDDKRGGKGLKLLGIGAGLPQILVSCIISLALAILMIFQMAPSKGSFATLQADFEAQSSTQGSGLSALTTKVNNMNTALGKKALKTDLDAYTKTANLDTYATLVSVTTLTSTIDTLKATVSDLEEKVEKLEEELEEASTSGSTTSYDGITVEVSTLGDMGLRFENLVAGTSQTGTVKVKITNGTGKDVTDIELLAYYAANHQLSSYISGATLSGTLTWHTIQQTSNLLVFTTGWGGYGSLSIKAGQAKTLYPMLTITPSVTPPDPNFILYFGEPEITCEGFEYD